MYRKKRLKSSKQTVSKPWECQRYLGQPSGAAQPVYTLGSGVA